jgi:hypothetical protein
MTTYWTVLILTMFVDGHRDAEPLAVPVYEGVRCCVDSGLSHVR